MTQGQDPLHPAIALLAARPLTALAPQHAESVGTVKLSERIAPPAGLQNRACHFRGTRLLS